MTLYSSCKTSADTPPKYPIKKEIKTGIYKTGTLSFNNNWRFAINKVAKIDSARTTADKIVSYAVKVNDIDFSGCENLSYDDSSWQIVNVPHDMAIAGPFSKDNASFSRGAWLPEGSCVYRKYFKVDKSMKGKRFEIYFDGAYRNSEVYLNGKLLGRRPYGYISFFYDMTKYISYGAKNVLVVKLDNTAQPGARWYTGTGIFRDVILKVTDQIYIPTWQNYITSNRYDDKYGYIDAKTTVVNDRASLQKVKVVYTVLSHDGEEVARKEKSIDIKAHDTTDVMAGLKISSPELWSVEQPNLYTVTTSILKDSEQIYTESIKAGIRTVEYSSDKGFLLNGEKVILKGVCLHNCGGPLGAALEKRAIERQIDILKSMGANAVRTAHNPFSTEFLNVCDEKGMIVMNEAFDEWTSIKSPATYQNGVKHRIPVDFYAKHFQEWSSRDLKDFVLRDRNHTSVAIWSIGNEIHEMKSDAGISIEKRLAAIVHANDYRPITNGVNGYGWNAWPNEKCVIQNDILGYNYITAEGFDKERKMHPDKPCVVTECSCEQSYYPRGTYLFGQDRENWWKNLAYKEDGSRKSVEAAPMDMNQLDAVEDKDAAGVNTFSMLRVRGVEAWRAVKERSYVIGQFIWTGFDYQGEVIPYGYPARSSSFAPIDLVGNPKDGYYFYQSQWSNKEMVHIFPSWNFKGHEGEDLPVFAYTNGDKVELFLNGKSLGVKTNNPDAVEYQQWMVKYEPGTLLARAYKKDKLIATDTVYTSYNASRIKLEAYNNSMKAGGHDLIYVTCTLLDKYGHEAVDANNMLEFEVEGPATIAGMGNGDNMCWESYQGEYPYSTQAKHSSFHAKAVVILKSTAKPGEIILHVSGDGLAANNIKLRSIF